MEQLLKKISQKALLLGDFEFSVTEQQSKWLGNAPASVEAIRTLEQRLNLELPEDYTMLLECTNGFSAPSSVEPEFLKTTEVDFLKNIDAELIEIWRETGNEAIAEALESSICIAGKNDEQQFLLIPPNASNEDWRYWKFAAWIPGEEVYENLKDYFQSQLSFLEEELSNQSPNKTTIAKSYIEYLSNGDLEQLLNLFTENGVVVSPVYGKKNYKDFYTQLFADTNKSVLNIKGIFEDIETGNIALHFNYQWTLKNDSQVNFEVVDILEFSPDNKIKVLTIIYDTVQSRELVRQLQ